MPRMSRATSQAPATSGRHATPLALERGVAIAGPDRLLAQLAHRERAVAPETALVLGGRVRERPAGTADEYEVDHPHKSSEARRVAER